MLRYENTWQESKVRIAKDCCSILQLRAKPCDVETTKLYSYDIEIARTKDEQKSHKLLQQQECNFKIAFFSAFHLGTQIDAITPAAPPFGS